MQLTNETIEEKFQIKIFCSNTKLTSRFRMKQIFSKGFSIYQVTGRRDKQGLNIFLDTGTLDVKMHHKQIGRLKGTGIIWNATAKCNHRNRGSYPFV